MLLGMSVRRAQKEIDSREFAYWQAFLSLEPRGEARGDWQAAMICSRLAGGSLKDHLLPLESNGWHEQTPEEGMSLFISGLKMQGVDYKEAIKYGDDR